MNYKGCSTIEGKNVIPEFIPFKILKPNRSDSIDKIMVKYNA